MKVEFDHRQAEYTVMDGDPLELTHHGNALTVSKDSPVTAPIPRLQERKRPSQPPGREPIPGPNRASNTRKERDGTSP